MKTIQSSRNVKKHRIRSSNYHVRVVRKMTDIDMKKTVKMVESSIKKSEVYPTELQLWRSLPEKTSLIALKRILMQLEKDNKIVYDKKDDSIIWTFTETPEARQSLRESVLLR